MALSKNEREILNIVVILIVLFCFLAPIYIIAKIFSPHQPNQDNWERTNYGNLTRAKVSSGYIYRYNDSILFIPEIAAESSK